MISIRSHIHRFKEAARWSALVTPCSGHLYAIRTPCPAEAVVCLEVVAGECPVLDSTHMDHPGLTARGPTTMSFLLQEVPA